MIQFLIDMPLQPFKGAAALKTSMGIPPSRSLKGDGGNWAVKLERFASRRKIEKHGTEGVTPPACFVELPPVLVGAMFAKTEHLNAHSTNERRRY